MRDSGETSHGSDQEQGRGPQPDNGDPVVNEGELLTIIELITRAHANEPGRLRVIVDGTEAAELGYDQSRAERRARDALEELERERASIEDAADEGASEKPGQQSASRSQEETLP